MSDSEPLLDSAAASGSRIEALEALRGILARSIDGCDSLRDLASLSQRFMDVCKELDALTAGTKSKGTPLDELKAKRAERTAASSGRPSRAQPARR